MRIEIENQQIELVPMSRQRLKSLWLDVTWTFDFYTTELQGIPLTVLKPKKGKQLTPMQLERYRYQLTSHFDTAIVFLLQPMPSYLRQRLAERGLFFIISGKYALLPFLYANRKLSDREVAQRMTPVAQYLLLWHLQVSSLDGLSVKELAERLPQTYINIARAVTTLEDLGLCESHQEGKSKRLHFRFEGNELWTKAQPFLINPIKSEFFCDQIVPTGVVSGINALAQYSHLNPEVQQTLAYSMADMKNVKVEGKNPIEGAVKVEVWKYPPIVSDGYVDRLSLSLILKDDKDPRVEKELDQMLEDIFIHDEL